MTERRRTMLRIGGRVLVLALAAAAMPEGLRGQVTLAAGAGAGAATAAGDVARGPWDAGVVAVGRVGRMLGPRAAASLLVDYQAFAVEGNDGGGRFRALYLVPSFALVRHRAALRVGVGAARRIPVDGGDGTWEVAVGALASREVAGPWAVEVGWRVDGTHAAGRHALYYLCLVRTWRP